MLINCCAASVYDPSAAQRLVRLILPSITSALEDRVKEVILDSMADILARLLPKAPRPLDESNLRPVSDVAPHPSRLQSLRHFLRRPNAEFSCPEQAVLLELMCRGQESVLGVLGTGKGKTLMVLLYAHMFKTRGITIVVLPLSTLRSEFMRRANEHMVSADVWTAAGAHNGDVALLCVSIEHLSFKDFQKCVYLCFYDFQNTNICVASSCNYTIRSD